MRDHEHAVAGVALKDVLEETAHPFGERIERLGIRSARAFTRPPAREGVGISLLDLVPGQAFPRAEPALAQARIEPDVEAEPTGHDLGGLPSARQIARIDHVDLLGELVRKRVSLLSATGVQGGVRVALPAAVTVPVGLAVARE